MARDQKGGNVTDHDVELAAGCPNQRCYVGSGKACVDAEGEPAEYPHAARRRLAESIERDVAKTGTIPEHGFSPLGKGLGS